jgi:hypothetical protein
MMPGKQKVQNDSLRQLTKIEVSEVCNGYSINCCTLPRAQFAVLIEGDMNFQWLRQFPCRYKAHTAIMSNVASVRKTLLQKEEYPFFQAIDVGLRRYLDVIVIERLFGEFNREEIGPKSYGATESTISGPER